MVRSLKQPKLAGHDGRGASSGGLAVLVLGRQLVVKRQCVIGGKRPDRGLLRRQGLNEALGSRGHGHWTALGSPQMLPEYLWVGKCPRLKSNSTIATLIFY